jgi:F0F1-type ATP synthase membrane subunit b/b'
MKQTGSLLRETLELEAQLSLTIKQSHADAQQAIEEAQLEATLAVDAACAEGQRRADESLSALNAEIHSGKDRQKTILAQSILLMRESYDRCADDLAEETAEEILRYGA